MKFIIICVVLISVCNIAQSDESSDAAAASDYYAKFYQDYYNSIAGEPKTHNQLINFREDRTTSCKTFKCFRQLHLQRNSVIDNVQLMCT